MIFHSLNSIENILVSLQHKCKYFASLVHNTLNG